MITEEDLALDRLGVERETAAAVLAALTRAGIVVVPVSERRAGGARLFLMSSPYDGGPTDMRGVTLAAVSAELDAGEVREKTYLAGQRVAASGTHSKAAGWCLDKLIRSGGRK